MDEENRAIFGYKNTLFEKKTKHINKLTSVGPPEFLHSMPHQHNA